MSRIGNIPVKIPEGVAVTVREDDQVLVVGPKGTLSMTVHPDVVVEVGPMAVTLKRKSEQKSHKALHGLYRSLLQNMVTGVSEGYQRTLEVVGVGYKASVKDGVLELSLGYAHGVFFVPPEEVTVHAEMAKGKAPLVHIEGIDKQLVGQVAAKLRALRPVEPYKGKGIRFLGEEVRRKQGKSAAK